MLLGAPIPAIAQASIGISMGSYPHFAAVRQQQGLRRQPYRYRPREGSVRATPAPSSGKPQDHRQNHKDPQDR
jgi:hypothetical protein